MSGDGGPLASHPTLSEAETGELVDRINGTPNLQPLTLEEAIHRGRYLHGEPGPMDSSDLVYVGRIATAVRGWLAVQPIDPIPMVLHCPSCGTQHIDEATPEWPNPPHRSHLCGADGCGTIWRPADVPTVGVAAVKTSSTCDNWPPIVCACPASGHLPNCPKIAQERRRLPMRDEGDLLAEAEPTLLPACNKAPPGRRCTLGAGHDGPCDTVEEGAPFLGGLVERQAVIDALAPYPQAQIAVRSIPHARG